MNTVDINAAIGGGYEGDNSSHDERVIKRLTSANIACGFHGGDPAVMQRSVDFAVKYGVAIGAHVGLPELMGLGGSGMKASSKKSSVQTLYQIGALLAFAKAGGLRIQHVKLHGVLYEQSVEDKELATAIALAIAGLDENIIVLGPENSELLSAAEKVGLQIAREINVEQVLDEDRNLLAFDAESIFVDSEAEYAVQTLDELRRALSKESIEVATFS